MANVKEERFINSRLAKYGIYEAKEKVDFSKYTYKGYLSYLSNDDKTGKKEVDLIQTVHIDGDDYFFEKRDLTEEDELFLKLKGISALEENTEILKDQEKHLRTIKNILVFFTVIAVISMILSIFMMINAKDEVSKYQKKYLYEEKFEIEKYL